MAIINQVQKTSGSGATSPLTVTFGSTPIQGNLLIAITTQGGTGQTADQTVAGFTAVGACAGFPGTGTTTRRVGIFYKIAGASESTSVVETAGAFTTVASVDLAIFEYSGLAISSVLDQVANDGLNSGTNVTSRTSGTTAATAQADELAIAAWGTAGGVTGPSYTNGFAAELNITRLQIASKIVSVTGTQESTQTWTTGRACGAQIATFKAFVSMLPQQVTVGPSQAAQRSASW